MLKQAGTITAQAKTIAKDKETIADQAKTIAVQAKTIADQAKTIADQAKTIANDKETIEGLLKKIASLEKQAAKPQDSNLGSRLNKLPGNDGTTIDSEKAAFMTGSDTGCSGSSGSGGTHAQQEEMTSFHKDAGKHFYDTLKDLIPGCDALEIF